MARERIDEGAEVRRTVEDGNTGSQPKADGQSWWRSLSNARRTLLVILVGFITIGAFGAGLKYLDTTAKTDQKLASKDRSIVSSINPFALPDPTPQLAKEYIYAGSRLLAVEDKNAEAVPPADLAVWRPSNGTWYVRISGTSWIEHGWGQQGDKPVPGDYDGDGRTDFSVVRKNTGTCSCQLTWYVVFSSTNSFYNYQFGETGDLAAPADYDGDGKTDEAIFRPSDGTWYIHASTNGYYTDNTVSDPGDLPSPADYDGDGKADLTVFRPTERKFYAKLSSNGSLPEIAPNFDPSQADFEPVSADYDGDGKADYAVYNKSTGIWYIRSSIYGAYPSTPVSWGESGDFAVPNDYDSDGKVDYAIWRPSSGTWYIVESANGYSQRTTQWGENGDTPVPAFYRR